MKRQTEIGFSLRIRLEWLERTSELVLAGVPRHEIQTALEELLQDKLSIGGSAERGARGKAISLLMKIWVSVPRWLEPFWNDGLEHLRRLPKDEHLAVHWGMTVAVYPFFGIVGATVGRLLRLQESVSAAQVQRRVREQLGERETVSRATRRVLRCLVDWGALEESGRRGVYHRAPVRSVLDKRLAAWLIEASLVANNARPSMLRAACHDPMLFPFSIAPLGSAELAGSSRLELFRHALDEDMIILRMASVPVFRTEHSHE